MNDRTISNKKRKIVDLFHELTAAIIWQSKIPYGDVVQEEQCHQHIENIKEQLLEVL